MDMSSLVTEVDDYILENIYNNKEWTYLTKDSPRGYSGQERASREAYNQLTVLLREEISKGLVLTDNVDLVAYQALWIVQKDDAVRRAEQGATYIAVDGTMIMFKDKDRTLSPYISNKLGIKTSGGVRLRRGGYGVSTNDTFRVPLHNNSNEYRRRGGGY